MAKHIPTNGPTKSVDGPLSLTKLQLLVGGFIRFIDLPSGDFLVVNEAAESVSIINHSASAIAGRVGPIYGDAVLCTPQEIE